MGCKYKLLGTRYEWEFKNVVEAYNNEFFVWHIGGSTPGWDNLLFKNNKELSIWNSQIPFEVKSFNADSKNWREQVIKQYNTYMELYNNSKIVTYYALRHKKLGQTVTNTLERWRIIPVTELEVTIGPRGGELITYKWDDAMPLSLFLDMLGGKKLTKAQRSKWKWTDIYDSNKNL